MIRNEKCEVLDKQNFEPKYRMVYDTYLGGGSYNYQQKNLF